MTIDEAIVQMNAYSKRHGLLKRFKTKDDVMEYFATLVVVADKADEPMPNRIMGVDYEKLAPLLGYI